jgi:hypothetical protein
VVVVLVVVVGVVDVLTVAVGVVDVVVVEHDSVTAVTGSFTGSEIEDRGVPAGTLTVNVSV